MLVRYLCLLVGEPGQKGPQPGSAEFMQMLDEYRTATAEMDAKGVLVDSGPLQMPESAKTLRVRGGKPFVTDGPFAESKEVVGGYYILDCADFDEVFRWMATVPAAKYGAVDVRPLMTEFPNPA